MQQIKKGQSAKKNRKSEKKNTDGNLSQADHLTEYWHFFKHRSAINVKIKIKILPLFTHPPKMFEIVSSVDCKRGFS